MSLNKVMLIGRLGHEPELRYTSAGTAFTKIRLATTETWKDKNGDKQNKTTWHNLVAWGKTAETMAQYLKKGQETFIEGKIDNSKIEKDGVTKYYTSVIVSSFTFIGSKDTNGNADSASKSSASKFDVPPEEDEKPMNDNFVEDDSDLPF